MRAKLGALVTATASMICQRPCPSQATMAIAIRMPGSESSTSTIRMTMLSATRPPMADKTPSGTPRASPITTEQTEIPRLSRAPYRTRANSSRP